MHDNIYAPPSADVENQQDGKAYRFYVVSKNKFIVLFVITLGIYSIYWFYKNWHLYKPYTEERVWPVPRAIFNVLFTHSLFREINTHLLREKPDYHWDYNREATIYVLFSIIAHISGNFPEDSTYAAYLYFFSIICLFVALFPCLKAQMAINTLYGDPSGSSNSRFSFGNIAVIILGLLFWGVMMFGYYLIIIGEQI